MRLTKKIFDWAEEKSLKASYVNEKYKETNEYSSEVFVDWVAMSITIPRLTYRLVKEKCFS